MNKCYIISGSCLHDEEADVRKYVTPGEARRMCRILKRAVYTSFEALRHSGIECPDAIITGTAMGCMENSEKFLTDICRNGEQLLKPTLFMQSTHNTIASAIAIHTACHGYNITFSHRSVSFDLALHDAALWLQSEPATHAFVGAFDEVTSTYHVLLRRMGFVGNEGQVACGEAAAGFLLSKDKAGAVCRLLGQTVCRATTFEAAAARLSDILSAHRLAAADIDLVVSGVNGHIPHDAAYHHLCLSACPEVPVVAYKPLFGECYSASALGFYVACRLLQQDVVPPHLFASAVPSSPLRPTHILYLNHSQNSDYAFALLQRL